MKASVSIRDHLIEQLRIDLIGPHTHDEELDDRPTVQYLTGILYPAESQVDPEADDSLVVEPIEDDQVDEGSEVDTPPITATMNPTSIGLTFAVAEDVDEIEVSVTYGLYFKQDDGRWRRHEVVESGTIGLKSGRDRQTLEGDASLEWIVRGQSPRNVSLFLVNRNHRSEDTYIDDQQCIFQPEIVVFGENYPFVHRVPVGDTPLDSDIESANLLYRDVFDFAVGHGCSVEWVDQDVASGKARQLRTSLVPEFELAAITPGGSETLRDSLRMRTLSDAKSPDELKSLLLPLLQQYNNWITKKELDSKTLLPKYRSTAQDHLDFCREALERMNDGIKLLEREEVFEAFRFANRVMFLQRVYGTWARDYRRTGHRDRKKPSSLSATDDHVWRPFQIAFILLNLRGVVDGNSKDRDLVDLLWFPTGGGKTEAYLGLAAFVMGLRRLRGTVDGKRGDGGVTVIMRYTLRLLTTQQFQRAATLICACEYLRRKDRDTWGNEPFSIGLWVGSGATPNAIGGDHGAEEAIKALRRGEQVTEGNPVQLTSCPWCGEKLSARNYHIDKLRQKLIVTCSRAECDFHGTAKKLDLALPVVLVDENIYRECPTLILATADKFARMPWKPQTMALFGRVNRYCPRHGYLTTADHRHPSNHRKAGNNPAVSVVSCPEFLPPELIIQDELHLISGPLGTLAGLYESVIDRLSSYTGVDGHTVRPKIIASTATIRRAREQINSLFARDVRLFPPPGLKAGDSFFAEVQTSSQQPGRTYLGVYAPGRSVKTALVRVYAILLQVAHELFTNKPENTDPFMTLVGYFNSLRELGGALRLVEDDIVQRLDYLASQRGTNVRHINNENMELTSRIPSHKIPEILELLERTAQEHGALDVLLATNMISVGVDVDRLGLMVVNGQPKTSAEYIQATSRVGRKHDKPGLVVTVYNWSRPRDISHYERFRPYHEAIYRHVEATSVTPFAPRARDKALHAVIISLVRLLQNTWIDDDSASLFQAHHDTVQSIREYLVDRVKRVESSLAEEVDDQIELLLDWWQQQADEYGTDLRYHGNTMYPKADVPVLMRPAEKPRRGGSRATLNSLREVEPEATLFIEWDDQ